MCKIQGQVSRVAALGPGLRHVQPKPTQSSGKTFN